MPKKNKNTYLINGVRHKTFASAAGEAADQSLQSEEAVAIEEIAPDGRILGYINIEATADPLA